MKSKIVPVSNIARLMQASDSLTNRAPGMPGMGLIFGATGLGKTTAVTWLITRTNAVYVRALSTTTPSSLLQNIAKELDIAPRSSNVQTVEAIVQKLAETGRALFVDEADYLVDQKRLVETLRDIHDLATVPVVLIGMDGIQRGIRRWTQLTGRIAEWVQFNPCTLEDAALMAAQLADVRIADDLVAHLHTETRGSVRLLVVGLHQVESYAKSRGFDSIALATWPRDRKFFIGNSPVAAKPSKPAMSAVG